MLVCNLGSNSSTFWTAMVASLVVGLVLAFVLPCSAEFGAPDAAFLSATDVTTTAAPTVEAEYPSMQRRLSETGWLKAGNGAQAICATIKDTCNDVSIVRLFFYLCLPSTKFEINYI